MAKLRLMRPPEKANECADMDVYLNGKPIATLPNGTSKEVEIPAGHHKLRIKVDSQGSKTHHITVTHQDVKQLVLSTNTDVKGFGPFASGGLVIDVIVNGLMLIRHFTIGHNRYLQIKELT